jgi:hypothetical protein
VYFGANCERVNLRCFDNGLGFCDIGTVEGKQPYLELSAEMQFPGLFDSWLANFVLNLSVLEVIV